MRPTGLAADIDALVELLRDAHRLLRAEAELARRLLLQGRGGEGRRRVAPCTRFFSTADDREVGRLDRGLRGVGAGLVGRSNCRACCRRDG